jgi:hypothetical protein
MTHLRTERAIWSWIRVEALMVASKKIKDLKGRGGERGAEEQNG